MTDNDVHLDPASHDTSSGSSSPYKLSIAMGTIDGLGRNLYSNLAAVLTELIANAWDADATEVSIKHGERGDKPFVSIMDNGCGMSLDELNSRFLTVGYRKRDKEGQTSPKFKRAFMGRKGIGKLSGFSAADTLTVMSRKEGGEPNGFQIHYADIEAHNKANPDQPFSPRELSPEELTDCPTRGTLIVMSNLRRSVDQRTIKPLRTRIARRFDGLGTVGPDGPFEVLVDGDPVSFEDREDLKRCEFIWLLGGYTLPANATPKAKKIFNIEDTELNGDGIPDGAVIKGWIGTVGTPSELSKDSDGESLRNIMVLARKRPIQEGLIDQLNFSQIFATYVTGQIVADFLDDENFEDIATSDRQRLREDDPRVIALKEKVFAIFTKAAEQWSKERAQGKIKELGLNEHVEQWIQELNVKDEQPLARQLLESVTRIHLDDEEQRKSLLQGAILAFDRALRANAISEIESAITPDFNSEALLTLLANFENHETHVYGRMIFDRIKVIDKLEGLLRDHALENKVRDFVASHPWLLNPAWERASEMPETKERTFRTIAADRKIDLDDARGDGSKRVDLAFLDSPRGPLIIEFKRPGLEVHFSELSEQLFTYASIMSEILEKEDAERSIKHSFKDASGIDLRIQMAVIVHSVKRGGKTLDIHVLNANLEQLHCVAFTYDQMLNSALERYSEFIEKLQQDSLTEVLRRLD